MSWKTLQSQTILKNRFFKVQKDKCQKTDGTIVKDYYTVYRPNVAIIAAFTTNNKLILIHQYRHPVKSRAYELPAGYIEPYEKNIRQAAIRELLEETGYRCKSLKKLQTTYASAGFMSNTVHFFIGFDAQKIQEPKLDRSEELNIKITTFKQALKFLKSEKIKDLGSVASILLVKNYLRKG